MKKECKNNEWDIRLKRKRTPRFKAGSELADKVNLHVDIKEDEDENSESTDVNLTCEIENKERLEISLNKRKKMRFKAGSDLTEKVNVIDVDFSEEVDGDLEISKLKMKLEGTKNDVLQVSVKSRKKVRFKAGADLTDKVNTVAVDWIEELNEDLETFTFSIKMNSGACTLGETSETITDFKAN